MKLFIFIHSFKCFWEFWESLPSPKNSAKERGNISALKEMTIYYDVLNKHKIFFTCLVFSSYGCVKYCWKRKYENAKDLDPSIKDMYNLRKEKKLHREHG